MFERLNIPIEIIEKPISITAKDGFQLSATIYEVHNPIANIIVAGATGVPQNFYRRFANFTAEQGYSTIIFDYRGIGQSKTKNLKGFNASFIDWATLDLAAIVDAVADIKLKTFIVGHSFGGHAFGLLPNHQKISGLYTFATGAGWHGWMPWKEALRFKTMWNVVLPSLTLWKGYTPMSLLGMGEDLPNVVYSQWRYWCQFPHYFFDDPKISKQMKDKFAEIRTPIVAANALDDLWALPKARDAFMTGYVNADITCLDIPTTKSLPQIGHMGYFRSDSKVLWDDVIIWIQTFISSDKGR